MLILRPYEVCPIANSCEYRIGYYPDEGILCNGCNPDRTNVFVCDLYKEKVRLIEWIGDK
jgi:hypothetical protein